MKLCILFIILLVDKVEKLVNTPQTLGIFIFGMIGVFEESYFPLVVDLKMPNQDSDVDD